MMPNQWRLRTAAGLFALAAVVTGSAAADTAAGLGELHHLLSQHPARALDPGQTAALPVFEKNITVMAGRPPVSFQIPGFDTFGCGDCHRAADLAERAADRLRTTVTQIETILPQTKPVPLHQYIIQAYTDDLLHPGQLAHATFDTIRIFHGAVIIDAKAYGGQTHLHETLHLAQPFLGHVNELEAYGLNVRADPRFLLLNYPYFADVVEAFFEPELNDILQRWFAREINEQWQVPREVQWFLMPFDDAALARLKTAIQHLKPALDEASRLYREHPYRTAYLSAQTGVRSLVLDIAAARMLPLPPLDAPENQAAAFAVFDKQMTRDDNTRLGYIIDRKQEALMTLQYTTGPKDRQARLALYFHYLKDHFIGKDGKIQLPIGNMEDFNAFIARKRRDLETMAAWPGLTPLEKEGARALMEKLKNFPAASK